MIAPMVARAQGQHTRHRLPNLHAGPGQAEHRFSVLTDEYPVLPGRPLQDEWVGRLHEADVLADKIEARLYGGRPADDVTVDLLVTDEASDASRPPYSAPVRSLSRKPC